MFNFLKVSSKKKKEKVSGIILNYNKRDGSVCTYTQKLNMLPWIKNNHGK